MKNYYRIMLGKKSIHAEECFTGNFIGADFGIAQDLAKKLPEEWRTFNREFIPIYLTGHPGKSKISAGLIKGSSLLLNDTSRGCCEARISKGENISTKDLTPYYNDDCASVLFKTIGGPQELDTMDEDL